MPTVDVKQAVSIALKYSQSLLQDAANLALEEVELTEDQRYWLVTVGFTRPSERTNIKSILGGAEPATRYYKIIKIDATTGDAVSMKIRTL